MNASTEVPGVSNPRAGAEDEGHFWPSRRRQRQAPSRRSGHL